MSILWDTYTKLLAQEGLNFEYSNSATTAYFDLENRTVVIPTFEFMTQEITQLLVSHEVAHAKYTVYSLDKFKELNSKFGCIFNIVEDAYIERKIQKEFPGLKEIFKIGYSQLIKNNFFKVDKPLNEYNLCERLNLYSKCFGHYDIQFEGKENEFALRIRNLNSSDEVIQLCEDILLYISKNNFKNKNTEQQTNEDNKKSKKAYQGDSNDENESPIDNNLNSTENEPEHNLDESNNNSTESCYDENNLQDELTDSISDALKENLNKYGLSKRTNHSISSSFKTCNNIIEVLPYYEKTAVNWFRKDNSKIRKNLLNLVKNLSKTATAIFQQKKSARELSNIKNRSVGKINMKKVQKYNITENIFKQIKSIPDGKNHAVIIMIDYSSSMTGKKISDTIIQATILSEFCYTNNIPFEVILFGSVITKHGSIRDIRISAPVKLCDNLHYKAEYLLAFAYSFRGSRDCYISMNNTPTFESILSLYHSLKKFKESGIEKTSVYIITDGVHSYRDEDKEIIIDNIIYDSKKYISEYYHKNWSIELACLFLKKQFDCYISISYIGISYIDFINLSGAFTKKYFFDVDNYGYIPRITFFDECMYILKHQLYFSNKKKLTIDENSSYLTYSFEHNPFIDQAQIIFSDRKEDSDNILTKQMQTYNIYSLFVNNFVDMMS